MKERGDKCRYCKELEEPRVPRIDPDAVMEKVDSEQWEDRSWKEVLHPARCTCSDFPKKVDEMCDFCKETLARLQGESLLVDYRPDKRHNFEESLPGTSALDMQVGGQHYKDCAIQPVEYIMANDLGFCEGNAIKYITRHHVKHGKQDIEKAIHYLQMILEREYKE
jgi:hypothetical protein